MAAKPSTFKPLLRSLFLQNLKVEDLICDSPRRWSNDLLLSLFTNRDIQLIKSIPLHELPSDDVIIWHFTKKKKGCFTLRSAYKVGLKFMDKAMGS